MIKFPPYLVRGDLIVLLCPAGFMAAEKVQACVQTLQQWGYRVKTGKTVGGDSQNYFSAPDQVRLDEFQQAIDDPEVKAVFCGRGGYGIGRIIDQFNFSRFKKNPKWIIGFSDVTILHAHIHANYKIATLHAPMASAFNDGGNTDEYVLSLKKALAGKKAMYQAPSHPANKKGEAIGELVGGNLSLLAHLTGTASDISTKGKILFLEDVGEYLYNIDRMLYQLKRSGKLDKLAGLVLGGFTEMKDTDRPFGNSIYEIIREKTAGLSYPVAFDFPVGHQKENYALKCGVGYKLKVGRNRTTLEE